jgi:hypothetical protein
LSDLLLAVQLADRRGDRAELLVAKQLQNLGEESVRFCERLEQPLFEPEPVRAERARLSFIALPRRIEIIL